MLTTATRLSLPDADCTDCLVSLPSFGQWPYARHSKIGRTSQNSGRLLTPEKRNLDVLSTFCGRKYGRLGVIQNPVSITNSSQALTRVHFFGLTPFNLSLKRNSKSFLARCCLMRLIVTLSKIGEMTGMTTYQYRPVYDRIGLSITTYSHM